MGIERFALMVSKNRRKDTCKCGIRLYLYCRLARFDEFSRFPFSKTSMLNKSPEELKSVEVYCKRLKKDYF